MKMVLNKYGEILDLQIFLHEHKIPHGEPLLVVGKHSCRGDMTLQIVARLWVALACRTCNFREVLPKGACTSNAKFDQYFNLLVSYSFVVFDNMSEIQKKIKVLELLDNPDMLETVLQEG